jgi:hypothetical protein
VLVGYELEVTRRSRSLIKPIEDFGFFDQGKNITACASLKESNA